MKAFIDCGDFYLRALQTTDLEGPWPGWLNDSSVTRLQNKGHFPNNSEKQSKYLEDIQTSRSDVVFALAEKTTDKHLGNVGLHQIDWINRTATVGILIGESDFRGRGWGKIAWHAITRYAFQVLNLEKLNAVIIQGNEASLKCALTNGFVEEGHQRSQFYRHGKRLDALLVGLTREDWYKSKAAE